MKREEVLRVFGIKTLPSKVDKPPIGKKCIAKVSRVWGKPDFAIFKDGSCIKDKGFVYCIDSVIQYYYDEPKVDGEDKLKALQKMAEDAKLKKLNEEASDNRPVEYKDMIAFIKEHELTEEKTFGMSSARANEILDGHFS